MEERIKQLEKKIKVFLDQYQQLKFENDALDQNHSMVVDDNILLQTKQQQAIKQIQNLITHLKSLGVVHE